MFLTSVSGQNETYQKANKLYDSGKYFEASVEYERVIFNNPNPDILYQTRYQKALCYRQLQRHEDALSELNRINLFSADDTLRTLIFYEKAFNYLLSDHITQALLNINHINEKKLPQSTWTNIQPLKILILNRNREWERAESVFNSWIDTLIVDKKLTENWNDSIDAFYAENNLPKNYSEETARNWSRFIPGAGHAYAGHPWEGAASFLLNASALGFGLHQLWYRYYFTGYVAGLGIFHKTYFGGMERAGHLANIERTNEMTEFNEDCTRLIRRILRE